MNTKTRTVGRPAAQLIYPEGTFTIKQLHALNRRKVRWELSIRQHIERNMAKRWIAKDKAKVHTGNVGKPADLFRLTKWGQAKLNVKSSAPAAEAPTPVATPVPAPAVEIPLTPLTETPVAVTTPTPVVETAPATPAAVVDATLAALTPAI